MERQHLLVRITRSVEQFPLTLICAPAGTGKTVLAADWAGRQTDGERRVAWLTVTERDNEPAVFWVHLQLALATVGAVSSDAAPRPMFPDAADIDALSGKLLRLTTPVVLVIDAAEHLRTRTIHDQIRRLLDDGGDRFRVVMTTRDEPALPVHRYRVENRVAEIRADDLALDREEIDQILTGHRLAPKELSEEVQERTEGWAAGVRLAALQLGSGGPLAELDEFARPYLRAEILAGLTPRERKVLTTTSVVEELPPGLAPALTGHAEADDLVRALSGGRSFVLAVRGRPGVFRLHPLVRKLLRAELDRGDPATPIALHRCAAEWFDAHGELELAVRHAAAAGDWLAAAARVVDGSGLAEVVVGTTTGAALTADLAAIPALPSPDVHVLRAAISLRGGDLDEARAVLDRADVPVRDDRRAAAVSLVRTAWCDIAGRPAETLEAAREARSLLDRVDGPDLLTAAVVATAEGAAQLRAGDLDAACAALGAAVAATSDADGPLRLRCLAELSLTEACAGRLTRALELVGAANETAADQGIPAAARPVTVELARAWVALERQDLLQARRSLDRVSRAREGRDDETCRTITRLLRSRYLRDRGDVGGARRQLRQTGSAVAWLQAHLDAESHDLSAGEHDRDVRTGTGSLESRSSRAGTPYCRLHDLLEHADRRGQAGDVDAARVAIGRALQLGRTECMRRPFAHASPRVWSLIRADARVHAKAGWLRPDQLGGGATGAPPVAEPVLAPLTEREQQVLGHLAAFLTTKEIAAEMFISVNTVRTHVRRVLEKLSVSRRHEAVRRGQELGLV